jgi:membrane-bound ClpP family serine protease
VACAKSNEASDAERIRKDEVTFSEIVRLIATSRETALQAVNTSLIELYWQVVEIISQKVETAEWGEGVVDRLADFIAKTEPGVARFHAQEPVSHEAVL